MGRKPHHIKDIHCRNAMSFKERLDLAKINRVKFGLDKRTIGDVRLTEALALDEDFEILMKKIERKPRKESFI